MVRTAARAPWQNGRVERHGGLIKAMIEKSREEMPPKISEIWHKSFMRANVLRTDFQTGAVSAQCSVR